MTYSKINLPELINEIIQYFKNDFSTLHSCILVNRLWCRMAIPLLWEDPFSNPSKNNRFLEIYLYDLNEEDKTKLTEYGINNNIFPTITLFNYPSFIKSLNTYEIGHSIEKWVASIRNVKISPLHTSPTYDQFLNFTRLIYEILFKIFIENGTNLNTFEVEIITFSDHGYLNVIFELILKNPNFVSNIKNLKLKRISNVIKLHPFLKFLYSNCTTISSLYFRFPSNDDNLLIENYLSKIINSQQNLKKISFERNYFPLYHSLLSLKDFNCANTLRTIVFIKINFKNIIILKEVFEQLNVLESVHILYCRSLNSDFVQQIINITKPFKLKSLFMDEILQIESSLQYLLQKSGDYLENFGFGPFTNNELKRQLLIFVVKYCTKIKFFNLPRFDNQIIYLAFNLIKNIEQNLNYLSIDFDNFNPNHENIKLSSIILKELGQILPYKLEYLHLYLMFNKDDFEIFLKNSQNTFINKLLIRNKLQQVGGDDILPYIEEFIMRKKRVKTLAFRIEDSTGKGKELFLMKDKVKEFELHDVEIQSYYNLEIFSYNFIKEVVN
ncbi:hypothetical protein RclHR1_05820004 [Rhizophagus clarus]|uniref:F-box domain-containing protein n=1 Tax=Rhizophagus clarus TaxID=94130 RepID=A0A2Z6S7K4_9GLOM|nr:hypothetical protein RclHR1_05820004 [Rhizophagus clarus]